METLPDPEIIAMQGFTEIMFELTTLLENPPSKRQKGLDPFKNKLNQIANRLNIYLTRTHLLSYPQVKNTFHENINKALDKMANDDYKEFFRSKLSLDAKESSS